MAMGNEHLQMTVVRRARVRKELKSVRVPWLPGPPDADWAAIAKVTGQKGYELFELLLLKRAIPACSPPEGPAAMNVMRVGSISYDTLQIAKGQAHADLGIEYVEWEPCDVEVTGEDGSLHFEKALPTAEQADAPIERR